MEYLEYFFNTFSSNLPKLEGIPARECTGQKNVVSAAAAAAASWENGGLSPTELWCEGRNKPHGDNAVMTQAGSRDFQVSERQAGLTNGLK